jgi:adenylate cyclase
MLSPPLVDCLAQARKSPRPRRLRAWLVSVAVNEVGSFFVPVGVGVHTGVAFVGSVGDKGVSDFTALGDAVNTAARLASAANDGEVLVTSTAANAGGIAGTSERRRLELRGRTEPVDVVVLRPGRSPAPT